MAFFISYVNKSVVDIFNENVKLLHRFDIAQIIGLYDSIKLKSVKFIKVPKIDWSCRQQHQAQITTHKNQI